MNRPSIFGYIQAVSDPSIEPVAVQKRAIEEHCRRSRLELHGFFVDPVACDDAHIRDRTAGGRLCSLLRRSHHLVVARFDGLGRSQVEIARVIADWSRMGVILHFGELGGATLDPTHPGCQAIVRFLAGCADATSRIAGRRTRKALAIRRATGQRFTRYAPWGFRWERQGRKFVMAPVEYEQAIMRQCGVMRRRGYSYDQIRTYLSYEWHVLNRNGNSFGYKETRRMAQQGLAELLRAESAATLEQSGTASRGVAAESV
jgi:DNA invertase Pin-like site-specific DNA recombinase